MSDGESKSTLKYWILGCGGVLLGTAALCAGVIWWGATKGIDMGLEAMSEAMVDGMHQAGFPESEVSGIDAHLGRWRQARADGDVSFEEMGLFFEEVFEHRLLVVAMVQLFEDNYLAKADLSVEDSAAAAIDLQRFARGIWEESIPRSRFQHVFGVEGFNAQAQNDDNVEFNWENEWDSPARLKEILTAVHEEVETAGVPNEPFHLSLSDEFGKIVDEAIQN